MSKHTPGPWRDGGPSAIGGWPVVGTGRGRIICYMRYAHPIDSTTAANAQLIAAAPDMLEALEMARDARSPGEKICASAMRGRAIAKAEGKHE